jgi:hypothetical protein
MEIQDLRALLYRAEERDSHRDSIGNFESQHCERRWESPLYYPIVNEEIVRRNPDFLDAIQWPDGKTFAACLTHDVDTVQVNSRRELLRSIRLHLKHAANVTEWMRHAGSIVGVRKRPLDVDLFTPWMELEARFGFHSTFFFFGSRITQRHVHDDVYTWDDPVSYKGKKCALKEVVRDIEAQGWSVGLHSSFLSARDENLLREQKEDLEKVLGSQVYSIRQHNLHHDVRVTPVLEDRVGFQVGCTQGFNRDVGFRSGIAYPCRSYDVNEKRWLGIVQIPLVIQDGALLRQDNLDLNEADAIKLGKKLIDRVKRTKGVIGLLWHPNSVVQPSWWRVYETLLQYIHDENGWGASAKEIRDWWVGQGLSGKLEKAVGGLR